VIVNAVQKWQRPIETLQDLKMDEMRAILAGIEHALKAKEQNT
jgi:hypothetical protein